MVSISSFHYYESTQKSPVGDAVIPKLFAGEDETTNSDLNAILVDCYSHGQMHRFQKVIGLSGLKNGLLVGTPWRN